jgi:hypothetical protein
MCFLVEHRGFEPLTSTLRTLRATNCANAPYEVLTRQPLQLTGIIIAQPFEKCKHFLQENSRRAGAGIARGR